MSVLFWISKRRVGTWAVISANGALPGVGKLLRSTDTEILVAACRLLGVIAGEETLSHRLIAICPALVPLLRFVEFYMYPFSPESFFFGHSHRGVRVLCAATQVLCHVSKSKSGAISLVHLSALPLLKNLLENSNKVVVHRSCCILGNISQQETLTQTVINVNVCWPLASILRFVLFFRCFPSL
jgi:hypothetical protein